MMNLDRAYQIQRSTYQIQELLDLDAAFTAVVNQHPEDADIKRMYSDYLGWMSAQLDMIAETLNR